MRLPGTGDGHGDAVLIRNPSPTRGEGKRGVRGRTFFLTRSYIAFAMMPPMTDNKIASIFLSGAACF